MIHSCYVRKPEGMEHMRNIVAFVSWVIGAALGAWLILGWSDHIDVNKVIAAVFGIGIFGVLIPIIVKTGGRHE